MITQILLGVICCVAVAQDVATGKIKNWFNVMSAVAAFVCVAATREAGVMEGLLGLAAAALPGIFLWRIGVIRAGDAKLMWSLGILKGWKGFGITLSYAILTGGLMALGIILMKKDFKRRLFKMWLYFRNMMLTHHVERYEVERGEVFPFSIPLALGCILEAAVKL